MVDSGGLTPWDRLRLVVALACSALAMGVFACYAAADVASVFFELFVWSPAALETIVIGLVALHWIGAGAVVAVDREYRGEGAFKAVLLTAGMTGPGAAAGSVALLWGVPDPTGLWLPIGLGLVVVATMGVARVAECGMREDIWPPARPFWTRSGD